MSEQEPISQQPEQPVDYLQEHPNAVVDPHKAEIMAYASKAAEEAVVHARGLALEAASNIGNTRFRDIENRGPVRASTQQAEQAQAARTEADNQAGQAAEIYDKVKGL
ncbi:MAG: hypothetical protein WCJ86_00195 [Candidatus Saccharibacteria bacterium]